MFRLEFDGHAVIDAPDDETAIRVAQLATAAIRDAARQAGREQVGTRFSLARGASGRGLVIADDWGSE